MVKKGKNVFGYGLKSKTGVLGKFAIKHFEWKYNIWNKKK